MSVKTLTIDGKLVSAARGPDHPRASPTSTASPSRALCHLEGLGADRRLPPLPGRGRGLAQAPARLPHAWSEEGMVVRTDTERLQSYRRQIVELLFAERNHVCAICVVNGHCELQELAYAVGMDHVRYHYQSPQPEHRRHPPALRRRPQPLHPLHALRAGLRRDRGRAHLGRAGPRRRRRRSSPTSTSPGASRRPAPTCGKCVQVCPTGALFEKIRPAGRDDQEPRLPRVHQDRAGEEDMDQVNAAPVRKPRVATVWLGGCSGCHMSFLDLDERLIDLAPRMDLVYSPIVDVKEFPEDVDVTLVEGAVANEDNLEIIHKVRERAEGPRRASATAP